MSTIKLNELRTFYSIQWEGKTKGTPSVFVNLAGCNLSCQWAEDCKCDTITAWKKASIVPFKDVIPTEFIEKLKKGARLVITGGEPMLQKDEIIGYLNWFGRKYKWMPLVEIETNGTIYPDKELMLSVSQWNVSPKLSSSGNDLGERFKEVVLKLFDRGQTQFKFVIAKESDILEIKKDYSFLTNARIWLMPVCETYDQQLLKAGWIREVAKDNVWNFSLRDNVYGKRDSKFDVTGWLDKIDKLEEQGIKPKPSKFQERLKKALDEQRKTKNGKN